MSPDAPLTGPWVRVHHHDPVTTPRCATTIHGFISTAAAQAFGHPVLRGWPLSGHGRGRFCGPRTRVSGRSPTPQNHDPRPRSGRSSRRSRTPLPACHRWDERRRALLFLRCVSVCAGTMAWRMTLRRERNGGFLALSCCNPVFSGVSNGTSRLFAPVYRPGRSQQTSCFWSTNLMSLS